jgi:hypothetical protein
MVNASYKVSTPPLRTVPLIPIKRFAKQVAFAYKAVLLLPILKLSFFDHEANRVLRSQDLCDFFQTDFTIRGLIIVLVYCIYLIFLSLHF